MHELRRHVQANGHDDDCCQVRLPFSNFRRDSSATYRSKARARGVRAFERSEPLKRYAGKVSKIRAEIGFLAGAGAVIYGEAANYIDYETAKVER